MCTHACNPSTGRLRQENLELNSSLGYKMRPHLKKTMTKKKAVKTFLGENCGNLNIF
jgi:hypothetical protein